MLAVLTLTLVLSRGQAVTVTVDPSVDNSGCLSAQQLLSTGGVESTCRTVNDALGNVTCQSNCAVAAPGDMLDGVVIRLVDGLHRLSGRYHVIQKPIIRVHHQQLVFEFHTLVMVNISLNSVSIIISTLSRMFL